VIGEYDDRVLFSTFKGEIVIEKDRIDDIFFDEPQYNFVYLAHRHLRDGSFDGAYKLFRRALDIDSEFYPAVDGLLMLEDEKLKSDNAEIFKQYTYEEQLGFRCEKTDDEFVVSGRAVRDAAGKDRVLIASGDVVSRIWGYPTKFMASERFVHLLKGLAGSPVRITIRRQVKMPALGNSLEREGSGVGKIKKLISNSREPVRIDILPRGLTITYVKKDDWRYGHLLSSEDRIVEIDGEPTAYMPLKKASALLRDPSGYVDLRIERDLTLTRLSSAKGG